MTKNIHWVLFSLSLLLKPVYDEIFQSPQNTLTPVGQRAILKCCSRDKSASLIWYKYRPIDVLRQKICEAKNCPNANYKINMTAPGCYDMIIISTSSNDSALYECTDGTGTAAAAYLLAYNCSSNIDGNGDLYEGDNVTYRCEIMSKERSQFREYWMDAHGNILNGTHFAEMQNQFVSTCSIPIQRPSLKPVTWVLKFLNSADTDIKIDMSTPSANWTSKERNVSYAVTRISTSCQDDACEKNVGDSVTCFADGHPNPQISWLDEHDKEVVRGPILTLNSSGKQRYRCIARNSIRGTSKEISISITVFVTASLDGVFKSFVVVSLLLILVILVFGKKIRRCIRTVKAKMRTVWRRIYKRKTNFPIPEQETRDVADMERDGNDSSDGDDADDADDDDDDDDDEDSDKDDDYEEEDDKDKMELSSLNHKKERKKKDVGRAEQVAESETE